jgi:hypothetical protein
MILLLITANAVTSPTFAADGKIWCPREFPDAPPPASPIKSYQGCEKLIDPDGKKKDPVRAFPAQCQIDLPFKGAGGKVYCAFNVVEYYINQNAATGD